MRRLLAVLLVLMPTGAFAWGREGHDAVWYAAQRMLTPAAVLQLRGLMQAPGPPLDPSWPDDFRRTPQGRNTGIWHFVDIGIDQPAFDRERDCRHVISGADALPGGDCAVGAVEAMAARLGNRTLSPTQRRTALVFLIHFVADLHQPLHAAEHHDRGGNDVAVHGLDGCRNLHAVWDDCVVRPLGDSGAAIGRGLLAKARAMGGASRAAMAAGTPGDWATETHGEGVKIYRALWPQAEPPTPATLTLAASYPAENKAVAEQQLLRASVRLAVLLNALLR